MGAYFLLRGHRVIPKEYQYDTFVKKMERGKSMEEYGYIEEKKEQTDTSQMAAQMPESMEPVHVYENMKNSKKERADDIALTQCILCVVLILSVFVVYWLQPEWYQNLIEQYQLHRDAAPVTWIDALLHSLQEWLRP